MAWTDTENRYRPSGADDRVHDACGLFGFIDTAGEAHGGAIAVEALCSMRERGNGLGAGYAAYGIYPEHAERYCLHAMCRHRQARQELDEYLRRHFAVVHDEPIPTRETLGILDPPLLWRYFVLPLTAQMGGHSEADYVVHHVMQINTTLDDAFVVSSGKNMGIFKGVGHPDQIAEYYRKELKYDVPPMMPLVGEDFNVTRAGIHADGLLKDEEIYNIFDTNALLNRPVRVLINQSSGAAGVVHWIHTHFGLRNAGELD
ncbi:MAG: hypothetical protein ACP5G7_10775, partial [Anaerolineae bacterium]